MVLDPEGPMIVWDDTDCFPCGSVPFTYDRYLLFIL